MIPIAVITGFLGAGKTTLIGRMLREPGFSRTAVIVNEFGEIGLDHELIESADETLLTLTNGCLCCSSQGDIARAFRQLSLRRSQYDRVVIETSGLAEPAPVLRALLGDRALSADHMVSSVLVLIDPANGEAVVSRHPEARRQVALADFVLYAKPDAGAPSDALMARIAALNPRAQQLRTLDTELLFGDARREIPPFAMPVHTEGLGASTIVLDDPLPAVALPLFLEGLREHCGDRLLRMKGLFAIEEHPEGPMLVHFVQGGAAVPTLLDTWPSDDRRTRLVVIGQDLPVQFPERLLRMIVADVRACRTAG